MVVIIGFEGSANKIGIGIIDDGKVRQLFCDYLFLVLGQLI
jgi:hypothetical protein